LLEKHHVNSKINRCHKQQVNILHPNPNINTKIRSGITNNDIFPLLVLDIIVTEELLKFCYHDLIDDFGEEQD